MHRPFAFPAHIRPRVVAPLALALLLLPGQAFAQDQKPNIVFIMADDLGYGDIGCYGQERIKTPHIDRMAAEGVRFTDHYAGSAVCAPARCALMTGRHMGRAEVRGNAQAEPRGQMPLSDGAVTVAEVLKQAGYRTALIGKWGLGIEGSSGDPTRQGFDSYFGYLDQVLAHNYYPEYLLRNGEKVMLENGVKYLDPSRWHRGLGSYSTNKVEYSNDLFTDEALRFIDAHHAEPFFLYLPYTIPHDNGEAPDGSELEVPDLGIYEHRDWPDQSRAYASMISRLDEAVGKILERLKEKGIAGETLVIFTSDNGPAPHYEATRFLDSNGPLRGGKRDLYEGGIRVPFVAYWPGRIPAGRVSDHPSAFWDFLPTAAEIAGVEPPAGVDGISYLPALTGEGEQPRHESLYWEFYEGSGARAVRKGDWKAVQNNMKQSPPGAIELYNLAEDPGEENDVASEHPDLVAEMKTLMDEATTPSPHFSFR